MVFNPQSQAIINQVLAGDQVNCGTLSIGPLTQNGQLLLREICDNFEGLKGLKGTPQAELMRSVYIAAKEAVDANGSAHTTHMSHDGETEIQPIGVAEGDKTPPPKNYVLKKVECQSFRGIAPAGERFEFEFDGKSHLIYGPNGSGKSSLLGSIIWALTGSTINDTQDKNETAPIHGVPSDGGKGKKLIDWPVNETLPDQKIDKDAISQCSVEILLASITDGSELHMRRSIKNGLEYSEDGTSWNPCDDLTRMGISPLDLQLSLLAPANFGRLSIEDAPNAKLVLGMMLGYDDLESFGAEASNFARNRTSLFNAEQKTIDSVWAAVEGAIGDLPSRLPTTHPISSVLNALVGLTKPDIDQIEEVRKEIVEYIGESQVKLAELFDVEIEPSNGNQFLADKLTRAVVELEKGVWANFPSLSELRLENIFPHSDDTSYGELLDELESELQKYINETVELISERFKWWRTESTEGNNTHLLLQAAEYYDELEENCPVCARPISDLPIKDELSRLKSVNPKLKENLQNFFRDLCDSLNDVVPNKIRNLALQAPQERLHLDWTKLTNEKIADEFSPLIAEFIPQIEKLSEDLKTENPDLITLLPDNIESAFADFSTDFYTQVDLARKSIALLRWSHTSIDATYLSLQKTITELSNNGNSSLLAKLSVGKEFAALISPLNEIDLKLQQIISTRKDIGTKETALSTLEEVKSPLDEFKKFKKYAEHEVNRMFSEIHESTISNWKKLYPESCSGLSPARIVVGTGRDKSVTAFLSKEEFEVPGQFFANAGLQRAVALSFYFSLLEKHPNGLGFVIMDDPILSLDDSHRERWSRKILRPCMPATQFIVATHQEFHFNQCKRDFIDGIILQLNDRSWPRSVSCRPGSRLDRAGARIDENHESVPNQMRMYCEELLESLETFANRPFVMRNNLPGSVDAYSALPSTDPLANNKRQQIVDALQDTQVTNVLNAGSHFKTSASVTKQMVQDCHSLLRKVDKLFKQELDRLARDYTHSNRRAIIPSSVEVFPAVSPETLRLGSIELSIIGRAAAKEESWIVDVDGSPSTISLAPGAAVLVTSSVLDPVARLGQWVLLADDSVGCDDGDLVAAKCSNGNLLLRRVWSDAENWVLQTINPVDPKASISVTKSGSTLRKIIGVLYEPFTTIDTSQNSQTREWQPNPNCQPDWQNEFVGVYVDGKSLDPIARNRQHVLIKKLPTPKHSDINNGDLVVVESNVASIGRVIKRVYHKGDDCVLISPNPVDPHPPEVLTGSQIEDATFWAVCGVLFELSE